jgi:hypothetical protein
VLETRKLTALTPQLFCNWFKLTSTPFANLEGNRTSFINNESGRSSAYARKSYKNLSLDSAVSDAVDGRIIVAKIPYGYHKALYSSTSANVATVLNINTLVQFATVGGFIAGNGVLNFTGLIVPASQGQGSSTAVDAYYMNVTLNSYTAIPHDTPFSTATSGVGMRTFFPTDGSATAIVEDDTVNEQFIIRVGEFTNRSYLNFGGIATARCRTTLDIMTNNTGSNPTFIM